MKPCCTRKVMMLLLPYSASCNTSDYRSNTSTGDNCKTDLWNTTSDHRKCKIFTKYKFFYFPYS